MKDEMSSFDIAAISPEIYQVIKDARIDNIYQSNATNLLFSLRKPSQPPLFLIIEAGKRLHITSYALEKPKKPPDFCMALRKHLKNGKVIDFKQYQFERVAIVRVSTKEGELQLISELFGGGNIILLNPQNRILHALVYRKRRDRNIKRGEVFQFAPPQGRNPYKLNRQDLSEIKNLGQLEIVRALTKFFSIGGLYAEEILLRARLSKNTPCGSLTKGDIDRIFDHLRQILSIIASGNIDPSIVFDIEKELIDVTPIPLIKHARFKRKQYKTFNEALDDYYTKLWAKEKVVKIEKEGEQKIARQKRILQSQQKALEDLKEKVEQNKKIGDKIYLHLNELEFLLRKILDKKKGGESWTQITLDVLREKEAGQIPATHFHSLEPKSLILNVSMENLNFSLFLRHSIPVNAADYYKKAKKAEKKLKGVKKAIRETQNRLEELQRLGVEWLKEKHEPPPKRRKKAWYEKFRWFYSSDGFLVIGGKDATTNEILIKRYMEPYDKVFHADIPGAPFVLIKTEKKSPPEKTIREATRLAASYSRAWKELFSTVDVYWFSPQQVSKPPPSGQYLKKGSFFISGPKKCVRDVPLHVAIGIKKEDRNLIVIGGPTEAIANQTNIYVKIAPGEQKSGSLAKQIQGQLIKGAPKILQKQILRIPLEEIQKFIPSGRGKIP